MRTSARSAARSASDARSSFDEAGELWVRRPPSIDATTAEWDVLRPDGVHRGTVALPAGLEVRAVARGSVYGVMKGEWDEDLVKRFEVRWN